MAVLPPLTLELLYRSSRVAWIGRLIRFQDAAFVQVLHARMQLSFRDLIKMNFDDKWINGLKIPAFYIEMLQWFKQCGLIKEPTTGKELRQQCIWRNRAICVHNKTIFCKKLMDSGVRLIDDFIDSNGTLLSYRAFSERFPEARIPMLTYLGWCCAIPAQWKRVLMHSRALDDDGRHQIPTVLIKGKDVPVTVIRSSFFYYLHISNGVPAAQKRWQDEGINFGDDWPKVYSLAFNITSSTKLQSLQYRILHRYWPTRRYLCIKKHR